MLIQAYCQQEREKRCTITANNADSNSNSNENEQNAESTDAVEATDDKNDEDGTKTPKIEPNTSPTPNEVEMIDATEPIITIKQEPEDEPMNVDMDPLAETSTEESNTSKSVENSEPALGSQTVKTETDENGNDSNKENSKDNQNDNDEPIKIEESTSDKDDPYSKDINIDPRTYCKLGHFHLLLEDYAKGR